MADSKIKTSSPMTFNYFRYDVWKKRRRRKKYNSRNFSMGSSVKMLRHILFLVATAHSAREKF